MSLGLNPCSQRTKPIGKASRWLNFKSDIYIILNKACKVTVKEQMWDSFNCTIEATFDTSLPIPRREKKKKILIKGWIGFD